MVVIAAPADTWMAVAPDLGASAVPKVFSLIGPPTPAAKASAMLLPPAVGAPAPSLPPLTVPTSLLSEVGPAAPEGTAAKVGSPGFGLSGLAVGPLAAKAPVARRARATRRTA